jgi:hypothetical protein
LQKINLSPQTTPYWGKVWGEFIFFVPDTYYLAKLLKQDETHNPDVVLGQSKWICPGCGKIIPRNKNAALNIRDEGLRVYRQRAR